MVSTILMIIGGIVFVAFALATILNFTAMAKRHFQAMKTFSMQDGVTPGQMGRHLLYGFIAVLGSFVFIAGMVWFLIERYGF